MVPVLQWIVFRKPPRLLTWIGVALALVGLILVAGLLGIATMPLVGEQPPAFSWVWPSAALALGAARCIIQLTTNWAQRPVSPTRATIIDAADASDVAAVDESPPESTHAPAD